MPGIDPAKVSTLLREAAVQFILPRYKQLAEGEVRTKGGANNLVTIADEESEYFLEKVLPDLLPGSQVIGEEATARDEAVMHHLAGEDWVWIVDPVDGTANFVNGRDIFCCMVALVHRGETVFGWIHDPLSARTLWAERGGSAALTEASGRATQCKLPQPETDKLSDLVAGLYNKEMAALKGKFARIRWSGCAGHDYWAAVEGTIQVVAFRNLKPWDHAPGVLIHAEAGGYSRLLTGEPYNAAREGQTGLLTTPNEDIWRKIIETWRAAE